MLLLAPYAVFYQRYCNFSHLATITRQLIKIFAAKIHNRNNVPEETKNIDRGVSECRTFWRTVDQIKIDGIETFGRVALVPKFVGRFPLALLRALAAFLAAGAAGGAGA